MIKIKPCPFCGGRASVEVGVGDYYIVECGKCGACVGFTVPTYSPELTYKEVAERYNHRASDGEE